MLSIEVQDRQGLVDIILGEDLDAPSISTVTGPCLRVLQQRPEMLVVQVDGIQFIDSRGVRFLMALVEEAEAHNCACAVVTGGNPRIHRVLQILRLEEHLPVYLTRASALRELEERGSPRPRRRLS